MSHRRGFFSGICSLLLVVLCSGCLQIETTVDYHDDGSATITERLNFSRRLLDMAQAEGPELQLKTFLQKEAALARMKHMGRGLTLVSHKIQEGKKGSTESITVFKTADLDGFTYVSPWFAYTDFAQNNAIQWKVVPMYKSRPYGGHGSGAAGSVAINFNYLKGRPKGKGHGTPDPTISPQQAQVYRELGPVFRDILRDLQLKLTFKAYCPVYYGPNPRGQRARARSVDIINITDRDLDKYGYNFFENEEIMLDVVRWELGSADVVGHVKGYGGNTTLPVYTPLGSGHMWWTGGGNIHFRVSKPLFDRYFKGKKLSFKDWGKAKPEDMVLATWERIGYHPERKAKPKPRTPSAPPPKK